MKPMSVHTIETLADMETPVSAFLKLCRGRPDSFLLESVETKDITGRYSIVAFDPILLTELYPDTLVVENGDGRTTAPAQEFFPKIQEMLAHVGVDRLPELPCVGSLMGFVGYDAVRLIEKLAPAKPHALPIARLVFPSRFVVFDHLRRVMILMAIDNDPQICAAKVKEIRQGLVQPLSFKTSAAQIGMQAPPKERFCQSVTKAQEYIAAGDIFQVVLSDAFEGRTDLDPFQVYRRLRMTSPSPYMFFCDFGGYQLFGCSPETLVKVRDREVTLRPIAGTRGRSDNPRKDLMLEQEMLASEKECAEHVMLVDLARNDAGRVCRYGSVSVDPYMIVERYSHVMHIVSQVQGALREDAHAVDAFMAGFPAGTVSGAPKVRAMEIIDELEASPRGPYAGAVGYFGPHDDTDTCIAIRTILFEGDRFTIRVGAGIVADSVPEMEFKEIENKAAQSIAAVKAAAREEL
ncbi:MAG: anthranilate synthase component I family protein [Thermodesulfobacteriota bacterium]